MILLRAWFENEMNTLLAIYLKTKLEIRLLY